MLPEPIAHEVFAVLLVFARTGSALMLLPGFGEPYVPARFRLLLALGLSLALAAPLAPDLPSMPEGALELVRLLGGEVILGLLIGAAGRMLLSALHIAGGVIAFQSGLAAAAVFDPNEATQGTLTGNLLTSLGLVLLFVTDGHHLLLLALAQSYAGLPAASAPPLDDMAELMVRLADAAFATGVRIAAPLLAVSILLYLGMGVLNRLMPSLQVFFIALPLQILIAFATLMLGLGTGLLVFFTFFEAGVAELTLGG